MAFWSYKSGSASGHRSISQSGYCTRSLLRRDSKGEESWKALRNSVDSFSRFHCWRLEFWRASTRVPLQDQRSALLGLQEILCGPSLQTWRLVSPAEHRSREKGTLGGDSFGSRHLSACPATLC